MKWIIRRILWKRRELLLEGTFLFDPNIYMKVVVTIEGDVSEEEVCEAVKKAYTQNQTTMSKIVLDEQGEVYQEEMSETGCKVFVEKRDWLEILCESERKPFRINEGELIRTYKNVDSMARILGLYGDERCELGITNLREVTFSSDYDRFKITGVIPVAPLIATTEKIFTISTYNGKMLIVESKIKQM